VSRVGGAAAFAILVLAAAWSREHPRAAAAGGGVPSLATADSAMHAAAPPADTSGLVMAPVAEGAREVGRVKAELDTIATGDADLRPDSVDAMLGVGAGGSRSRDSRLGGSSVPQGAESAPTPPPADPAGAPDPRLPSETGIPVAVGLRLTSVHHYADGDREKVVSLSSVSSGGVEYEWRYVDEQDRAVPSRETFSRIVSAADLARAPRLNQVFESGRHESTPGYTAMSLSRAVYAEVRRGGTARFSITDLDRSALGASADALGKLGGRVGGMVDEITSPRVTLHGTLASVAAAPEPFAVLLDGRRVAVPALHLRGAFTYGDRRAGGDYWVLADSAHPLILREAGDGEDLRIVRIDRPSASFVEGDLASGRCRAELPGIYFAFASAGLEPESHAALAGVARLLAAHRDWSLTIEGHTDSIGGAASNQALSERRAAAVRAALVSRYGVAPSRLTAKGFGATRPLESNATVEGRARNRRVEAVRPCGGA
jgi:outer membrane protein OmpA-like peptidoglycan-associated protein